MDPKTGKVTTKLVLEDKPRPPSKLSHTVRDAPGNAVAGKLHQEIRKTEDDNVGVESAHKSEEAVETGVHLAREGYRSHKLKPYRKAAQAERKLEKANVNAPLSEVLQENPQLASNPLSRWQQKQQIKKQYAAAKRAAQSGGTAAGAAQKIRQSGQDGQGESPAGRGLCDAAQKGIRHRSGPIFNRLPAAQHHVLLLHDGAEHRFDDLRHHLSFG